MSFVDALCISSGFNCNHFSNIIDCKDGRILYSADMVLVNNTVCCSKSEGSSKLAMHIEHYPSIDV